MEIDKVKECFKDVCHLELKINDSKVYTINSIDELANYAYEEHKTAWEEYQKDIYANEKPPKTPPINRIRKEFTTMLQITGYYDFINSRSNLTISDIIMNLLETYFEEYRNEVIRKKCNYQKETIILSGQNELTDPNAELISQIERKDTVLFYQELFYLVTIWVATLCDTKEQFKNIYENALNFKDRRAILKYTEILQYSHTIMSFKDKLTLELI